MKQNRNHTWDEFKNIFKNEILPIYEKHEQDFDYLGIHGIKHITRSIIFGEIITRFYEVEVEEKIDFNGIRMAISFHDAGREGNGKDLWESQSTELCFQYLLKSGEPEFYSRLVADTIINK